jgi:hypothetical protein
MSAHEELVEIIKSFGAGALRDHSECSLQFRAFLSQVSTDCLRSYTHTVLTERLSNGGLALQDLVNAIGLKLGFDVEPGLYRGRQGEIGFDGLWMSDEADFLVEVKTSDAYRINLDTIANYAKRVRDSGRSRSKDLSMLLVVGRQDTGDLEAQVRGSKHAWETRIIGVEALLEVAEACEEYASEQTKKSVRELLLPVDYTRLDSVLRKIVTAINETETLVEQSVEFQKPINEYTKHNERAVETIRDLVIADLEGEIGAIGKTSSASFCFGDQHLYVLVSKRYNRNHHQYWYAFSGGKARSLKELSGLVVLGMKDRPYFFLLPSDVFLDALKGMNKVIKGSQEYWQVAVSETNNEFFIDLPLIGSRVDLSPFKRSLS